MKPLGGGEILESGVVTAQECLRYAMNLPVSVVITGIDSIPILEQALASGRRRFKPMANPERSALLAKTEKAAAEGRCTSSTRPVQSMMAPPAILTGWVKTSGRTIAAND